MGNPFGIEEDDPIYQAELQRLMGQQSGNKPGFASAFKNALGSQVQGIGQLASDFGWKDNPIESYGKGVQARNPMDINSLSDIWERPGDAIAQGTGMALGYIVPSLVGRGANLAGKLLAAPRVAAAGAALNTMPVQAGLAALPSYGGIREQQEQEGNDSLTDKMLAGVGAAAVGGIEMGFGPQRMLGIGRGAVDKVPSKAEFVAGLGKTPLKTAVKQGARVVGEEMGEELVQNPIEQLSAYQDPRTAENINQTLTGAALAGMGTLGFGAAGGAHAGLQHNRLKGQVARDLLNPGAVPLGDLRESAEWNKEFLAKDEGQQPADEWYNDFMLGQFSDRNQQIYQSGLDETKARLYGSVNPDTPLLSAPVIPAEGGEHQVSLERLDVLQGRRDATAAAEEANTLLSDSKAEVPFEDGFDFNNQNVPVPTDLGSALGTLVAVGKSRQANQPIVNGSPLHEAMLGADRIIREAGLDPAKVFADVSLQLGGRSGQQTKSRSAQQTNAAVGSSAKEQRVPSTKKARGQQANEFEAELASAIASGNIAESDDIVAAWNESRKTAGDAKMFKAHLADKLSGPDRMPPTAEQRLKQDAVVSNVSKMSDATALGLTTKQTPVFDYIKSAIVEGRASDVLDADGTFKYSAIGDALGMARGSAKSFIDGAAKKIAESQGVSVDEFREALRNSNMRMRRTEVSDHDLLGLSPAQQRSVVDEQDLFGNDNGAEQNMGIVNSIGGSQSDIAAESDVPGTAVAAPLTPEQQAVEDAIQKNRENAAIEGMREEIVAAVNNPRMQEARSTWDELVSEVDIKVPEFDALPARDAVSWINEYANIAESHADANFDELWAKLQEVFHETVQELETSDGPGSFEKIHASLPHAGSQSSNSQNEQARLGVRQDSGTAEDSRSAAPTSESAPERTETPAQAEGEVRGLSQGITIEGEATRVDNVRLLESKVASVVTEEDRKVLDEAGVSDEQLVQAAADVLAAKDVGGQLAALQKAVSGIAAEFRAAIKDIIKRLAAGLQAILVGFNINVAPPADVTNAAQITTTIESAVAAKDIQHAAFGQHATTVGIQKLADSILTGNIHKGQAFLIVDKPNAKVYVFQADGSVVGTAPTLLGKYKGDELVTKPLEQTTEKERVTPAGIFNVQIINDAEYGTRLNLDGGYGIAMHRVYRGEAKEQRPQRLKSLSAEDNRISWGCMNVTDEFYDSVIQPTFNGRNGTIFITPDSMAADPMLGVPVAEPTAGKDAVTETRTTDTASEPDRANDVVGVNETRKDQRRAKRRSTAEGEVKRSVADDRAYYNKEGFHGTNRLENGGDFTLLRASGYSSTPSTILGVHLAVDPAVGNNFAKKSAYTDELAENGRVLPVRFHSTNPLVIDNSPGGEATQKWRTSSDDHIVAREVASRAISPRLMLALMHEQMVGMSWSEKVAEDLLKDLRAGKTVRIGSYTVSSVDDFVYQFVDRSTFSRDETRTAWQRAAVDFWKNSGYDSVQYQNTSATETKGASDKTAYIVPPSGIRSRFAQFDKAARGKNGLLLSTNSEAANVTEPTTASAIKNQLKVLFFSGQRFDNKVVVVQSSAGLDPELRSKHDAKTQAFVKNGKVYLIANNIEKGKELAVFLHEVGAHLGMEKLLGAENYAKLVEQVKQWAENSDGKEGELARKALRRVLNAEENLGEEYSQPDFDDELLAYFVEEAVLSGTNPTAIGKAAGPMANWFRTFWAAVKLALRKFGLDRIDQLSAQNIVDIAYGAARLELEGTWHGTAAEFRRFDHSYMGSGEGAQAYGWGTYLAQRVGIAKGYWKDDVGRKYAAPNLVDKDGNKIKRIWNGPLGSAHNALVQANGDYAAARAAQTGFGSKPVLAALDVMEKEGVSVRSDNPEGSLMRVDANIHDDEFLDWDKPLSEQSEVVKEALATAPRGKQLHTAMGSGEGLYKQLVRGLGSDKAASEYLDSIGIKGIKFLDAQSRGVKNRAYYQAEIEKLQARLTDIKAQIEFAESLGKSDASLFIEKNQVEDLLWRTKQQLAKTPESETRNLVIFNDKNIVRVATQRGARRDSGSIKYSKSGPRVEANRATGEDGHLAKAKQVAENLAGKTGALVAEDTAGVVKKMVTSMAFLHDLVDEVATKLPSAKDWYKAVQNSISARRSLEQDAEKIATKAGALSAEGLKRVNDFIAASTFEQKWGYDATFKKETGDKVVKADAKMAAKFRELMPEEQSIVKEVFAHGEMMADKKFALLKKLGIDGEFSHVGKLVGPYAPLKRFGSYIGMLKSKELRAAEDEYSKNPTSENQKRVTELKQSGDNYVIRFFDTRGQAKQFAKDNAGKWFFTDSFEKSERAKQEVGLKETTLEKVMSAVRMNDSVPDTARKAMLDMVRDMYFSSLDEHNARLSGVKRKNMAGFDEDMIRSFLSHSRAEAGFLANMEFGGEINDQFYKMQQDAKDETGHRVAQDEFNALAAHYAENLNYKETPVQDRVMALTSAWQLATSIGYHLTNFSQGVMVTIPKLAADFNNYQGAWSSLMDGYKTLWATGWKPMQAFDPSTIKNRGLRAALEFAANMGVLDVGMDEDLTQFEATRSGHASVDKASGAARTAIHKLRQVSRSVETANRVSSAVAAYNMMFAKTGSTEKAQEYAVKILQTTQGEFSRTGAPLLLKKLPKFVTQYRKYQFMMAALYAKAFRDAFFSADPEVKAIGKRMLAYKMFHTSVAAGLLGLPLMNLVGLVFSMAGGDDDEPADLERSLRKWIGDEDLANLLLHGPLNMLGLDMSSKLGDDKIFSISPYSDFKLSSKQDVANTVLGLAGPAASQAGKFAEGFGFFGRGDYYKGVEQFMPKGVSDAMRAFRLANEGFTLKNGDLMVKPEDINGFSVVLDGLGVNSAEIKQLNWLRGQQYELQQFYKDRSKKLQHEYVSAYKDKDTAGMSELRDEWNQLQAGKDKVRYLFNNVPADLKKQPMSSLIRSPFNTEKRERKLQTSVPDDF